MIHDVNPHVINHWFQFGFTKKFKAVSTKYCCNLCNRSFFCFHNLCRWICKLVNLHMYLFLLDHHFKSGQIFDVFSLDHHFKPGQIFDALLLKKNSFQIISPIRWQMGDEVWKPTDVQFYKFIYSQRVLFSPENILVDYVCRFGFNLWILDFIDFCETTSDRHFLFNNSENKVLYGLFF